MKRIFKQKQIKAKEGFILFYAMGTLALMSLAAMIAINSARLESRTARNHYDTARALYHAEAGVKLTQRTVENRLANGETLSEIIANLLVTAPDGVEFDDITAFKEVVPDRMFSFETIGRSNEAKASVVVHLRRRPLIQAGLFGVDDLTTLPNVTILGYDSRVTTNPTADDSNGGASIGSNGAVDLGNHLVLDGMVLLGESYDGMLANCSNCALYAQVEVGHQDPDPLGLLDGGTLAELHDQVQLSNDNFKNSDIINNTIRLNTGSSDMRTTTLTAGDYYLTDLFLGANATLAIDDSDGPVRIFMAGQFHMHPNADVVVDSKTPWGFQVYSNSTEEVNLQPNGNLTAFVYAPDAKINLQPGNSVLGAFWGRLVNVQPGTNGVIWLDTSLSERMLMNNLETHSWYEQQGSF